MLDDAELAIIVPLYTNAIKAAKGQLDDVEPQESRRELLDAYERIIGVRETSLDAIWHHRLSDYGPPCLACGKPLRTPLARHCAECGVDRA